jgi:hypothetical protein
MLMLAALHHNWGILVLLLWFAAPLAPRMMGVRMASQWPAVGDNKARLIWFWWER